MSGRNYWRRNYRASNNCHPQRHIVPSGISCNVDEIPASAMPREDNEIRINAAAIPNTYSTGRSGYSRNSPS